MRPKQSHAISPSPPAEIPLELHDEKLFINRDLSLLAFQRRVLAEARDESHPLLERLKFLAIVGSNLDEFFMVRVAGRKQQVAAGIEDVGIDGLTPAQTLTVIREEVNRIFEEAREYLHSHLIPALHRHGIHIEEHLRLLHGERRYLDRWFREKALPLLNPVIHNPRKAFPQIDNLSIHIGAILLEPDGTRRFAMVRVPGNLPQLVPLPRKRRHTRHTSWEETFIWLEEVIAARLPMVFPGLTVRDWGAFRLTRDAELDIQQWEAIDLLDRVRDSVRRRHFGTVARLAIEDTMPEEILEILVKHLKNVEPADIYRARGPLGLRRLMELNNRYRKGLHDKPFRALTPSPFLTLSRADIFAAVAQGDILLHHPFESFKPVVRFFELAATDDAVESIQVTLYRVGPESPIVHWLLEACRRGKQVRVVVELKARFDEVSNIGWAKALEQVGAKVVYGIQDLKVHAKLALVVRREPVGVRRFVHFSSGNYNAVTSKIYTDLGLLTSREDLASDAAELFDSLMGERMNGNYRKLLVAPVKIRERMRRLILREIDHARSGSAARLIFKMNALVDKEMIQLLYLASQAGVKVDLLVRGVCCLRPGIQGVSDGIRVCSIVGRFLEHSRAYYFLNGGQEEIYLGSADLMPRNLDRRVEVLFPVEDEAIRNRVRDQVLGAYLADNVKSWQLGSDGTYAKRPRGTINSQDLLLYK
jgi:polyphosphate kinase